MKTSNGTVPKNSSVNIGFKSFNLQIVNSQSAIIILVLTFMLYFKLNFKKRT